MTGRGASNPSPRRRMGGRPVSGSESPRATDSESGGSNGVSSPAQGEVQVSDECWSVVSVDTATLSPFFGMPAIGGERGGRGSPGSPGTSQPRLSPTQMAAQETAADISNIPLRLTISPSSTIEPERDCNEERRELGATELVKMAAIWFGCSCVTNLLFFEAVPSQVRACVWGL